LVATTTTLVDVDGVTMVTMIRLKRGLLILLLLCVLIFAQQSGEEFEDNVDLDSGVEARFHTCTKPEEAKYYRLVDMACHETCLTVAAFKTHATHMHRSTWFQVAPVEHACAQFEFTHYWTSKLHASMVSVEPEYDVYVS
jgi:hypothetical protein